MELIWYGLIYSVAGFGLEILFARATGAPKRDRKCMLLLPMCPVYGIGAMAIVSLPEAIRSVPVLLVLWGGVAATAAEYLLGLFYEKVWRVKFWDYKTLPGNLHGRVCLTFSVIWGLLALPLVYWLHPLVAALAAQLPNVLLLPVGVLFGVDFALTGWLLRRSGDTESLIWYR